MFKTPRLTSQHETYWRERKADWEASYGQTINHPHRDLIIKKLKEIEFGSLLEIGCNCGPNLLRIQKEFPRVELGGVDINADSIAIAKRLLPAHELRLETRSADNIYFSDKSIDVLLTDATLIYIGPDKINKVMGEIARIARKNVILCEFQTRDILKQIACWWKGGYYARDYEKLLKKFGFYDIEIEKIPVGSWQGES